MNSIEPTGIYTADDAAEIFNLQKRLIWQLFGSGEMQARQVGKRWYTTGKCLLEYIENAPKQHKISSQAVKPLSR